MPVLAIALYVIYLGLAFGLRSLVQRRRTGSAGFIGVTGSPGSPESAIGLLFGFALAMAFLAPVFALSEFTNPSKR